MEIVQKRSSACTLYVPLLFYRINAKSIMGNRANVHFLMVRRRHIQKPSTSTRQWHTHTLTHRTHASRTFDLLQISLAAATAASNIKCIFIRRISIMRRSMMGAYCVYAETARQTEALQTTRLLSASAHCAVSSPDSSSSMRWHRRNARTHCNKDKMTNRMLSKVWHTMRNINVCSNTVCRCAAVNSVKSSDADGESFAFFFKRSRSIY